MKACLESEKANWQAERRKAIEKFQAKHGLGAFDEAARLYDLFQIAGKTIEIKPEHLDLNLLVSELKQKYQTELDAWQKAKAMGDKKRPKRAVFWQLLRAINNHAGFAAKQFMDQSFESPDNMALANVRANISGYKNSIRWNQAVSPKKGQRAYGATGEPQYKRRMDGFTYPIPQKKQRQFEEIIRKKRRKFGNQIYINVLPEGMRWIDLVYHREIPPGSIVKQITINNKAGRYFAVFSLEVPVAAWQIASADKGWRAGIDPGAETALTIALANSETGELRHLAVHYEILDKGLEKLEKMQQALALKKGPTRKRTTAEINAEIGRLKNKKSFLKLSVAVQEKEIKKLWRRLESTHIRQEASKRWLRWSKRVSTLQMRFANQRADLLHKISRVLTEGCDLVAMGNWEPEREVSFRKKLRAAHKKVKQGIEGAQQELDAIINEKSKQGPKGARKKRRGARDRSIASLRRLVMEKAERASITALTEIKEAGTTFTCSTCGEDTGPHGDLSV